VIDRLHNAAPAQLRAWIDAQDARVITIGPDDPSWARRVAKRAVEARNRSVGLANASAWYAEVAQRWPAYPPGLTPPVLG
jgi:hypothetical protein